MPNVQLTAREAVNVFIEVDTKRILGIAPASCRLLGAAGIRYTVETVNHARTIEKWIAKLGEQTRRDAEVATLAQIQRESKFRKMIRDKLLERNKHVNQYNQDLSNVFLRLMDQRYDRIMKSKMNPVVHGMAEASEARGWDDSVETFAKASPAYKNPGDARATGEAVEFKQIERDRRA